MRWLSEQWGQVRGNFKWDLVKFSFKFLVASLGASIVGALYVVLQKVRNLAWDWWVFGGLLVTSLVLLLLLNRNKTAQTGKDEPERDPRQSDARALASLPVYRQDLEIELLAVCVGATLGFPATVFLLVKPWAKKNLNIVRVSARIFTNWKGTYEGVVLRDLSEWLLREEFNDPKFNMMNSRKTNLESASLSLVKEIESGIYQEGHHTAKWLGCRIDQQVLDEKEIRKVTIRFHDKDGIAQSEVFEKWPVTSLKVINIEFG